MPKIIGETLADHRAITRRRVFDALVGLIDERGYDSVSLAQIAERAGIGRTALYNHFADKEAIVLAFTTDETEAYVADLEAALRDVDDPVEAMRTYVARHLALSTQLHLGLGTQLQAMLSREALMQMREHVVVVSSVLRRVVTDGVASGAFVDQDLDAAVSLVHACLQARLPGGPLDPAAVAACQGFVLRALGAPA